MPLKDQLHFLQLVATVVKYLEFNLFMVFMAIVTKVFSGRYALFTENCDAYWLSVHHDGIHLLDNYVMDSVNGNSSKNDL